MADIPSTGAPETFLVQTTDLELRQLSRALVSTVHWWRTKFPPPVTSGPAFTLKPVRTYEGLPVFTLDMPVAVLDCMLDMMHVPELQAEYWMHLPKLLTYTYTLAAWRGYMRAFGFDNVVEEISSDDEDSKQTAKKARTLSAFDLKLERVATALHTFIFENHPNAAAFLTGVKEALYCHFASRWHPSMAPADFVFTHEDLTDDDDIIGWWLMHTLRDTQRAFFLQVLKRLAPTGTNVRLSYVSQRDEHSKSRAVLQSNKWPLSPNGTTVTFSKQHHEVVALVFEYI
jgi:hypothetical protein